MYTNTVVLHTRNGVAYLSVTALSLIVTALIVAGNQRALPRAVGIPASINPSAID